MRNEITQQMTTSSGEIRIVMRPGLFHDTVYIQWLRDPLVGAPYWTQGSMQARGKRGDGEALFDEVVQAAKKKLRAR